MFVTCKYVSVSFQYVKCVMTLRLSGSCENLRTVYENTGDEDIPGKLLSICKRDGKGTHVACDVYETTNWAMAGLGAQLMRAAEDLENEEEAEAPAASSKGKSLRK